MDILLLAIDPEDLLHDEEIPLIGVASRFVFERLEGRGGEGAFARQEEAAVVGSEEVVELGLGEAQRWLSFGGERPFPDLEAGSGFGLEGDSEQFFLSQGLQSAFEGGGGDIGGFTEVVVAHTAGALAPGEMPETQVDGLLSRAQIRKHGA